MKLCAFLCDLEIPLLRIYPTENFEVFFLTPVFCHRKNTENDWDAYYHGPVTWLRMHYDQECVY